MANDAALAKAIQEMKAIVPYAVANKSGAEYDGSRFRVPFFNRVYLVHHPDIRGEEERWKAGRLPHIEVLRLAVVDDQSGRALLRLELERLGKHDADTLGIQQRPELYLILQARARRIAEAVTRALVALFEDRLSVAGVAAGDAPFNADLLVDVLSQGLSQLDTQAVQMKVIVITVRLEQLP